MPLRALFAVVLAACGTSPAFPDAASVDAAILGGDASPSGTASVTVQVRSLQADGAPDPTATVFFANPDGTIAAEASPDATGKVTRTMTAGGSVSVGRPVAGDLSLVTVLGVEDGDLLVFGPPDTALDQTVQVTVPPRAGAGGYEVAGPCVRGFGGTELTFTAYVSRPCGPSHSLLAVAAGSGTRAYLVAPAVSFAAGAPITVTGTWVAESTVAVDLTGLPIDTLGVAVTRSLLVGGAAAHQANDDTIAITAGTGTASFTAPAGYGDTVLFDVDHAGPDRGTRVRLFRSALVEAAPLDVSPALPRVDVGTHTGDRVGWTLSGDAGFDAVVIDLDEVDPVLETRRSWRVIAPPTGTEVRLPALRAPFDLASLPLERLRLVDSSEIASYAAFRASAGAGIWIDEPPIPAPAMGRWEIAYGR